MNKPVEPVARKAIDGIQQRLTDYAYDLKFESLSEGAVHDTKARVIDTLGALLAGFDGEPCRIARTLASQIPVPDGTTVIGTRTKTTPDMAAFVNGTTGRYAELNDAYHRTGVVAGHASDVLMPVLAAAEHAHASGRDFITAVALAYEVHLRIADAAPIPGFDYTNYVCLGSAIASGKLFGLDRVQLAHCISMAVVPNVTLAQVRTGHISMFKAVAAGHGGRAGVFAALLARAGMHGPHLPFEGKAGWCNHVSRKPFALDNMGGHGTSFKIEETLIKPRSSCGTTISSALAGEKVVLRSGVKEVEKVVVEVYGRAKHGHGTGEHHWNPQSRETADHSVPYVVAAAMMDGMVTPRSFDDAHLKNPELRALLGKIEVVENVEFTKANELPVPEHRTRVTVTYRNGEQAMGETGGGKDDLSAPMPDAQIVAKFRGLSKDGLGEKRVDAILETLWKLEEMRDVGEIPPAFVLD